jgi:hypothetical protein
MAPRKLFVEVTTAAHPNEYLARHLLHEKGGTFGVKGISRDKKTRKITSTPTVNTPDELAHDLSVQIISLILEPEWNDAIERVTQAKRASSLSRSLPD